MAHFSSSSPTSSPFLLVFVVVPLLVISVVVGKFCYQSSSNWLYSPSPWTKRSGLWTSSAITSVSSTNKPLDVRAKKEAPIDTTSFNASSSQILLPQETPLLLPPSRAIPASSEEKPTSKLKRVELGLARARVSISEASQIRNLTSIYEDADYVPRGPIYRNANAFHRSYLEMENLFKIFVYKEGEPPMFHDGPCKSIYSTEGRFIHEMEKFNRYRTTDPDQAHVYFLPFSVVMMVQYLYVPGSHDIVSIGRAVVDYVSVIAEKHPFWNRSLGADHFMLSCHDWGPRTSSYVPQLFQNSIRVLCNANTSEGFNPSKDASFPEIHLRTGEITGLLGGLSPSRRSILAFFAGRLHGDIRLRLLETWKGKDEDVQVQDQLPSGVSYERMLKKSKYCLCPSGYEVASPRIVEAIYAECVPVLISNHYVPPFSDVLNWNSFSVQVPASDIPNIKRILMGISPNEYVRMQRRVKQVQRHFVVNGPPKRFDVFHMILHSIWLRRLNVRIPPP